jgi:hypothetical protein
MGLIELSGFPPGNNYSGAKLVYLGGLFKFNLTLTVITVVIKRSEPLHF